jgi:hypothetical protein
MSASATINGLRSPIARRPSVLARVRAHLQAGHLDHELARGVDADSDPALAQRARYLLRPGTRARIADSLEEVVRTANRPVGLSSRLPVRIGGVRERDLGQELKTLAAELRDRRSCGVRGVALVQVLLTDTASPLYGQGFDQELMAAMRQARRALRSAESS